MFGYVKPNKPLLLVKEYEEYKAVYCTLCKELGKRYNIFTRLALNYDICFYALISLNYNEGCPNVKKGRCVVNPLKRCNYVSFGDHSYHKAAALTVLMTYHKIIDNINDEKFVKSLGARLSFPFFKRNALKAAKTFPKMAYALDEMTKQQREIEKKPEASIDECCEPTAKALSEIFSDINEEQSVILGQIGYFLGRWVYTMDAADDLKKDISNSNFNPFVHHLKKYDIDINDQDRVDEECNSVLNSNVAMLIPAFNLLKEGRYTSTIENVVKKGLPQIQREILFLHIKDKERKKA